MFKLAQQNYQTNMLKDVWSGIKSAGNYVGDLASRAYQGWNTLLDPKKGTPSQKVEWLGKGLKSTWNDFVPGMAQGAINLPANLAKGVTGLAVGGFNYFTNGIAKNKANSFKEKAYSAMNPFMVDFAGNRKGVNREAFGVGEFAGETAASTGVGVANKLARMTAGTMIDKGLKAIPKPIQGAYAKTITKLTGDPHPLWGPEMKMLNEMKKNNVVYRGVSKRGLNSSYAAPDGEILSADAVSNRVFYSKPENFPKDLRRFKTGEFGNMDIELSRVNNENGLPSRLSRSNTYGFVNGSPQEIYKYKLKDNNTSANLHDVSGRGAIFVDKKFNITPDDSKLKRFAQAISNKTRENPVSAATHEFGHILTPDYLKEKYSAIAEGSKRNVVEKMQLSEGMANRAGVNFLKQNSNWYNPTNWFRDLRHEAKFSPFHMSYRAPGLTIPSKGYNVFGKPIPSYLQRTGAAAFITNSQKVK